MHRLPLILLIASIANPLIPVNAAQQTQFHLTMKIVMTPSELRDTGVSSLTPSQRTALDKWLNEYTKRILRFAATYKASRLSSTGVYAGLGGGHWISNTGSDGAIITLEDGSIWQISSVDQVDTALWLPTTSITVIKSRSPIGDYKYELINTDDNEKALAKYLGQQ